MVDLILRKKRHYNTHGQGHAYSSKNVSKESQYLQNKILKRKKSEQNHALYRYHFNLARKYQLHPTLLEKSKVVTVENKHSVIPWIAEFWCTITSLFFALPLFIYVQLPWDTLPFTIHLCISLSVITATISFLYHLTNFNVYSTLDVFLATIMVYFTAYLVLGKEYPLFHSSLLWTLTGLGMGVIFLRWWKYTALLGVAFCALLTPGMLYGLFLQEAWHAAWTGLAGFGCFVGDRYLKLPLHSGWHILGGLSLWWCLHCAAHSNLDS